MFNKITEKFPPADPEERNPKDLSVLVLFIPKLYKPEVAAEPVPARIVVLLEYHDGIVELSVHVLFVPLVGSESKFCV